MNDLLIGPLVGHPYTIIGVVPVLVGPLSALMALLPAILIALGSMIVSLARPRTVKRLILFLWAQKFVLLPAVAIIWSASWGYRALFGRPRGTVSAAESVAADWPLWRGNLHRTAHGAGEDPDPGDGRVQWVFTDGKITGFYSSPAVIGNRVYVTSAMPGYFSDRGGIYCLDADTGREVWAFRSGYRATFSSPSIAGRYLVVGEGLHQTSDARVFCFDREESERRRTPVKLWEYRTNSHVESSAAIANGRAYIGAGDDGFYCFNLDPDAEGKTVVRWHLPGDRYPDCETSPLVHEGRVYFGLGIGGQAVVCADADTGEELWRMPTPAPVFSAPAVRDGRLFFAMGWGDFVNTAEQVASNARERLRREGKTPEEIESAVRPMVRTGEVWCVDLSTRQKIWTFQTSAVVLGAVAADGDRVYFNARDGKVYSVFAADGRAHRMTDLHTPIVTSPAVGRDHVYVVTNTGRLVALDKERFAPVWQTMLRSPTLSSPAVARGRVYVGTSEGGLLCVGSPGGEAPIPVWRGEGGGPAGGGCVDGSPLPTRGAYGWDFADALPEADVDAPSRPTSTPALLDRALFIGWRQGHRYGLRRLQASEEGWGRKPSASWFVATAHPVRLSPAADRHAVYYVEGEIGDANRALRVHDSETGAERWRRPIAASASGEFFLAGSRLFIADRPDGVSCLDVDADGAEVWSARIGAVVGSLGEGPDLLLVALSEPRAVVALDALSGTEIWRQPLASDPFTGPIWCDDYIWIGESDGLAAYPIVADDPPLRSSLGAVIGRLTAEDNRVFAVTSDGALLAARIVRNAAGEAPPAPRLELARIGEVVNGCPPLVTRSVLLYSAGGAIHRYDPATGADDLWMPIRPQWPGPLTTAMTMTDSHVFFGTERRGLVCIRPKE